MSGGSDIIAQTTNYVFYIRYTSSCGTQYVGFGIRKLKPKPNKYGYRDSEWDKELSSYSMTEDENNKYYEALKELEMEREITLGFKNLSQNNKTLADIWNALKEAEHNVWVWKSRAEKAEEALSTLHDMWYDMEERRKKEANKNVR